MSSILDPGRKLLVTALEGAKIEKERIADPNSVGYASTPTFKGPGRLGDPRMSFGADPRLNAKIKPLLETFGVDKSEPPPFLDTLKADSSLDEIAEPIRLSEEGMMGFYNGGHLDLPEDDFENTTERAEKTIPGGDGQDMKLYIYRPSKSDKQTLPCVVYTHGGGMTLIPTLTKLHELWCKSLAASGLVVVMVDFRNAWTKEKYSHFPAGLNDCAAALRWVHSHKAELNIGRIVCEGESGGGNLALSTALKANKEGWISKIDGVYAMIPYISNAYGWSDEEKLAKLPSLVECNGYILNEHYYAFTAFFYTPTAEHQQNPLAWPLYATHEDMKGLPPHMLSMNELDPLRDEGIAYARRLAEAGVNAKGSVELGVGHGIGLFMRGTTPEYWNSVIREISGFAKSL